MSFASAAIVVLWFGSLPLATLAQELKPLPPNDEKPSSELADLGKLLFFDPRLSGDATISCATCHDPGKAFTDGMPLSTGYPGSRYFRNTPTLLGAAGQDFFYWDARLSGDDLPSLVRDHIAEAHFMQADGRLVIERLRQVPEYEKMFREVAGGEPSYGKILNAIAAFVASLGSREAPLDRYLRGDQTAMPEAAVRGLELFRSKADCTGCHYGERLSDGKLHNTGVPENPQIFSDPLRHITFRRFMRTIGVGQCATLRKDIGHRCVTKDAQDDGKFRTPSLREVSRTAPYMHNGAFSTLSEVVAFYNDGGGSDSDDLQPLELSSEEQADLVEFLKQLTGEPLVLKPPELPAYQLRTLGEF